MSAILGTAAVLIRGDMTNLGGDMSKAKGVISAAMGGLSSLAAGPLALLTGGLAAAGVGVLSFGAAVSTAFSTIAEGVEGFKEASMLNTKLEAVLKATGNAAGLTADQLREMADQLQNSTIHEGDAILGLQTKLLTFKSISGEVFQRTLEASLDLADAGFGSAEGTALQLGKALENPTRGMNALTRSGVTFTDAEKKKIKVLQESGKLLEAQEIILKAVEGQVGGTARAIGKTDAGRNSILKNILGDSKEKLGEVFLPIVNKFLELKIVITNVFVSIVEFVKPVLTKVLDYVMEFVMDAAEWFQAGFENFGAIWAIAPKIMKAVVLTLLDYWIFFREALPQYLGYALRKLGELWVWQMTQMLKGVVMLITGIGDAFMALPGIISDALSGKGTGDAMEKMLDVMIGPIRGLFNGLAGELPDWSKAISDSTKKEWSEIGDALGSVAKRKKELEAIRGGFGKGSDKRITGKGKGGGGGDADAPVVEIDMLKIMPTGFVGFEQLGRTIQENLLKEDAKKVAERTAKATEGGLVALGSMDKKMTELVSITKEKSGGGGFLSDDGEGPL